MTDTDPLQELEQFARELPAAVERRRIGETLGKTVERLRDADAQVERIAAIFDISNETGFGRDPTQADALSDLLACISECADSMLSAQTAVDLKKVQEAYARLVVEVAAVDRQLRPHWRGIVEHDFRPLAVIGTLLQRIETTKDLGLRLVACGQEAEASLTITSAVSLRTTIHRLREKRTHLENERTSATRERDVDAFLSAVAEGRGTLRMVTSNVHQWLARNEALDMFTITARARN
jgi:hypothetical protein